MVAKSESERPGASWQGWSLAGRPKARHPKASTTLLPQHDRVIQDWAPKTTDYDHSPLLVSYIQNLLAARMGFT